MTKNTDTTPQDPPVDLNSKPALDCWGLPERLPGLNTTKPKETAAATKSDGSSAATATPALTRSKGTN